MSRPWTDRDRLVELYWDKELSQAEIAEELDCSIKTVERWFRKFDIETRDPAVVGRRRGGDNGSMNPDRPWADEEKLHQMYVVEGHGMQYIADEWDTNRKTIRRWLDNHDIERKSQYEYYGGGIPSDSRTKREQIASYERCRSCGDSVFIHQLLAISKGYDPNKVFSGGEYHTHHKNGIPWDNRPSNIELLSRAEHIGNHVVDA